MNYITDGNKLKKLMIDRDVPSISALSVKTKVGRDTLSRVIRGKIRPSADVMYKLVDGLQIPPNEAGEIFFVADLRNT